MPAASPDYQVPTSHEMLARQDELAALRLLISQRRLYRVAKRWLGLRWFGMLVIGLAAPVVAVSDPDLATAVAAVAGAWLFLGRTFLQFMQSTKSDAAASIQEKFDFLVFGMPSPVRRRALPSLEEIANLSGANEKVMEVATREKLLAWYPIRGSDAGVVSVAISQRANASYSDRLLRTTGAIWTGVTVTWLVLLVAASCLAKLSLTEALLGVALPVLPAFLDVVEYLLGIRRSAQLRGDLVTTIEARIRPSESAIDPSELQVWQDELYDLRRSAPQVPDFVYALKRKRNERAMHISAAQLGDDAAGEPE